MGRRLGGNQNQIVFRLELIEVFFVLTNDLVVLGKEVLQFIIELQMGEQVKKRSHREKNIKNKNTFGGGF